MLNHARTLLLNLASSAVPVDTIGYELIDDTFVPVEYSGPLAKVRQVLFGTTPDIALLTYRTTQYLALLHGSPLEEYLRSLDSRISYLPLRDSFLALPPTRAELVSGSLGGTCDLIGRLEPPDVTGRMHHTYDVAVTVPGIVTVADRQPPFQIREFELTLTAGRTNTFPIGLSGLSAALNRIDEQAWVVSGYSRPQQDLVDIVAALGQIGEATLAAVFEPATAEPYKTFQNLWQQKKEIPLKLGGLLTAFLGRCEERRRNRG